MFIPCRKTNTLYKDQIRAVRTEDKLLKTVPENCWNGQETVEDLQKIAAWKLVKSGQEATGETAENWMASFD